jgi:hypothetical protein
MLNESLKTYITGSEGRFDGALPINYTVLWNPTNLPITMEHLAATMPASGAAVVFPGWDVSGDNGANTVRFETTATFTGGAAASVPHSAAYAAACFFLLSGMNEAALKAAFESLSDIHTWYNSQSLTFLHNETPRSINIAGIDRVERVPFAYRDE